MTFKLVYLSQQDPQWKNDLLGFGDPGDTIGMYGCALTSVAMLVSGHGYNETPKSLNEKLKAKQGFVSSGIRWDVVGQVHSQVTLRENIPCETTDAPLNKINAALDAGQPVVVRVDSSPAPGLQWHYVMLYARKGNDYLMLDPYPYSPGAAKEDLLMARYSRGNPLERSIQQVLIYQCSTSGGTISLPSTPSTTTTTPSQPTPAAPLPSGPRARVMVEVTWGLNIRSSTDTSSLANLVVNVPAGTELLLIEANVESKIGVNGQWVRVRTAQGKEGFAAAWYLEKVSGAAPAPVNEPVPSPVNETPVTPSTIGRSRPSAGDGLENVPMPAPADKRLSGNNLLAFIWNKYGGILTAIAEKMNFDPAIAVAILTQESGGQAYGADGRLLIRFENHLFYEFWGKNNTSSYNNFFKSGTPIWTGHQWRPKASTPWQDFHGNQSKEWEVFTFASKLDDTAAKKSISMGLPQVLGMNFGILGFASVQDMFNAFVASERNQVAAFFDFLQGNGPNATNALKTRDFRTIASIYNGAGAADQYGKLINGHYNDFLALRGIQPPAPQPTPPKPSPVTPASGARARVMASVTAGLNVRSSTDTSSLANLVVNVPAGTELTLTESGAESKIGINGQWARVRTAQGQEGFAAAWYLEKVPGAAPAPVNEPAPSPVNETPASPPSPPSETPSTPVDTSTPSTPAPPKFQVVVKAAGTKIYSAASVSASAVITEKAGARLTVVEPAEGASAKIGVKGKWINVKATNGSRGFVDAEKVRPA